MTLHAKNTLRRSRIAQVLDLLLAISASEALGAKGLVTRQDRQVLDLISTRTATVCAIAAY